MNEITEHEEEFCKYMLGMQGDFAKPLYDLMLRADRFNQAKLIKAFPKLEIVPIYTNEDGYWTELTKKWNYKYPDHKLLE